MKCFKPFPVLSLLIILFFDIFALSSKSVSKKENKSSGQTVALSSGLIVHFSSGPASSTLKKWANDIEKSGGSVSHYDAVNHESEVVSRVNSGQWSPSVYHEYQRLAAGTGNVDSARLLMDYGVGYTLMETSKLRTTVGKLFKSITSCNIKEFLKILSEEDNVLEFNSDDGTTPLIAASYSGCLQIVEYLMMEYLYDDIEAVGASGITALMAASSQGHVKIVELLVTKGKANVNTKHKFAGTTALHMSSELNRTESINILCSLGADPKAITSTGSTPLHTAASVGASKEAIFALIRNCSSNHSSLLNGDTTPLYLASQNGHAHTVEALLHEGADVSFAMPRTSYKGDYYVTSFGDNTQLFMDVINSEPGNGAEAIHAAAEEGHPEVVRILVRYGANINSLSMGAAPLHLAAQYNRIDVTNALISLDADINKLSYVDGSTPIYNAIGHENTEIVDILLKNNASLSICQTRSGGCPLLFATLKGNYDIVLNLLKHGANVNEVSPKDGLTPLFAASINSNSKIMKILIDFKANICYRLPSGESILHESIKSGIKIDVIDLILLRWKNNIESVDRNCQNFLDWTIVKQNGLYTALHLASKNGYVDAMLSLIRAGSNLDFPVISSKNHQSIISHSIALLIQSNSTSAIRKLFEHIDSSYLTKKYQVTIKEKPIYLTPLILAVELNNFDIVKYIVTYSKLSIDINDGDIRSGIYQSPLLLAVIRGYLDITKLLLDNNANCLIIVASKINDRYVQENLLDICRKKRDYDMLQLLSSYSQCYFESSISQNYDL